MSNAAIGNLYKRIIDQVVELSRSDFEENGVTNRTVGTFQETWQGHLSQRRTATFPWDPAPASATDSAESIASRNPPSAVSNTSPTNNVPSPNVQIKQEPGQEHVANQASAPPATGLSGQERAEYLVQQRRMGGMNTYQNSPINLPGQQGQPSFGTVPYPANQQYQQNQQQRPQQQWSPQQQQQREVKYTPPNPPVKQEATSSIGLNQTDGTAEEPDAQVQWSAVMTQHRELKADAARTRKADGILRHQLRAQMREREAGGLLVPIDERYSMQQRQGSNKPSGKGKQRAQDPAGGAASPDVAPSAGLIASHDGPDDDLDDDIDKDAINSDLDDPEDEVDDGTVGEEYEGDTIICLYDKVQRVKNKWKCTLKDGVVNADGKDYVFHKANGEFEW